MGRHTRRCRARALVFGILVREVVADVYLDEKHKEREIHKRVQRDYQRVHGAASHDADDVRVAVLGCVHLQAIHSQEVGDEEEAQRELRNLHHGHVFAPPYFPVRVRHPEAEVVVHDDVHAAVDDGAGPHGQPPVVHGEDAQQREGGVVVHVKEPELFLAQDEQKRVEEVVVLAEVEDVAPEEQGAGVAGERRRGGGSRRLVVIEGLADEGIQRPPCRQEGVQADNKMRVTQRDTKEHNVATWMCSPQTRRGKTLTERNCATRRLW